MFMSDSSPPAKPRSIVYIDGFNLYYGALKHSKGRRWLDLEKLFRRLRPDDDVWMIRYFTARVIGSKDNPGVKARQSAYLKALGTTTLVQLHLGKFKTSRTSCRVEGCMFPGKRLFSKPEEKRTDVNIALWMLDDAYQGNCERMIVVSGDSDLVPALELVRMRFPAIKVHVYVPRQGDLRVSTEIRKAAHVNRTLPIEMIEQSQFPDVVQANLEPINKPASW